MPPATPASALTKDVPLPSDAEDSISELSWSPTANHLAVASWDRKVRIYEVDHQSATGPAGVGRALFDFEGPVLSCDWSQDGKGVVAASADKTARVLDLGANGAPAFQVAAHSAPIRSVRFFSAPQSHAPMIVTGSWDKTVKYWDMRAAAPAASIACAERVHAMDVRDRLLVIATADRGLHMVDLERAPTAVGRTVQSPLKWQTRTVACFTDASCFAIGSIEGRCAFHYVEEKNASSNFSFRCHRNPAPGSNTQTDVYAVNAISFHPTHGTFSTAGSDGTYHFWDKDAHHRLKAYPSVGGAITSTGFNHDGTIFAYAVSYDWSKGHASNTSQYPTKVALHPVDNEECRPKVPAKKR